MRFTQIIAAAVVAAPLVLAVPVSVTWPPATTDLSTVPDYATAISQVKERFPDLTEEDANTAALGYLEAVGVQVAGYASNSTGLVWLTLFKL